MRLGRLLVMAAVVLLFGAPVRGSELRGLWVDAWGSGMKGAGDLSEMVRFAKAHRFNAIFVQVRRRGDVYYDSSLEPKARDCAAGFDALGEAIRLGHAAGLEVHAWLVICPVGSAGFQSTEANHVMNRHPEWVCQDVKGEKLQARRDYYLDVGIPEVRDYLAGVCEEVARKYAVDGIHLDYFRYPSIGWGYSAAALDRFRKETGRADLPAPTDEGWKSWRRQQLEALLRRIGKSLKQERPKARLSLAGFCPSDQARDSFLQDWKGWLKKGWVDFVVPMVFARDTATWTSRMEEALAGGAEPIYPGIGSYLITPEETLAHIEAVRKKGARGFVLYSYGSSAKGIGGPGALTRVSDVAFPRPETLPWGDERAIVR